MMSKPTQLLTIKVHYGRENRILDMASINLTPEMASELVKVIEVLVLGYPELDKLEQPENVRER